MKLTDGRNVERIGAVRDQRGLPRPPARLSPSARTVWKELSSAVPSGHFVAGDLQMVEAYCTLMAYLRAAWAANDQTAALRLTQPITTLAVKLRLTPSSRYARERTSGKKLATVIRLGYWDPDKD